MCERARHSTSVAVFHCETERTGRRVLRSVHGCVVASGYNMPCSVGSELFWSWLLLSKCLNRVDPTPHRARGAWCRWSVPEPSRAGCQGLRRAGRAGRGTQKAVQCKISAVQCDGLRLRRQGRETERDEKRWTARHRDRSADDPRSVASQPSRLMLK